MYGATHQQEPVLSDVVLPYELAFTVFCCGSCNHHDECKLGGCWLIVDKNGVCFTEVESMHCNYPSRALAGFYGLSTFHHGQ